MKNCKGNLDLTQFVFTSYLNVLVNLRTAMRGGEFDYHKFISEIEMLDSEIIFFNTKCK